MAKEMVDGNLCTDKSGYVRFYGVPTLDNGGDWWNGTYNGWFSDEWKKTYDLKPPKPGEKFYVSIEL